MRCFWLQLVGEFGSEVLNVLERSTQHLYRTLFPSLCFCLALFFATDPDDLSLLVYRFWGGGDPLLGLLFFLLEAAYLYVLGAVIYIHVHIIIFPTIYIKTWTAILK